MTELNADLLFGAGKVAAFIGVETRSVYHWMDRRRSGKSAPPVFDVGGQVCGRRSELSSWFSGYRDLSRRDEASSDGPAAENYEDAVTRVNETFNAKISGSCSIEKDEQSEKVRE